jgi:hypothetical protein
MRLTPWCPAAHDALPRARSLRLHVLGQRGRSVDFLLDVLEVGLDLRRRDGAQAQAEPHRPNAQFHRGEAIQDAVSNDSGTVSERRLFHL